MTGHRAYVDASYRGGGWWQGACRVCRWRGPWREDRRDAARDAVQHIADVDLVPDYDDPR